MVIGAIAFYYFDAIHDSLSARLPADQKFLEISKSLNGQNLMVMQYKIKLYKLPKL